MIDLPDFFSKARTTPIFLATPPVHGAFVQYLVHRADWLHKLPDGVTFEEGAMLEPLSVGIHAVRLAPTRPGDTVVVLGSGPIGLMTLAVARLSGAGCIIATDLLPWRLEFARRFGATCTLNAREVDVVEAVRDITGGRGADVVYEAAGKPETFQQAFEVAARCATVAIIGIYAPGASPLSLHSARRKELTIRMVRRFRFAYPLAIDLVRRGEVRVADLITHRFSLEEVVSAFELVASYGDGVVRAVILP